MTTARPRRGRTPSVDAERLAAAVREVGARESLTMAAVAGELSVDVTTLYRHVGGLDALRRMGATICAPTVTEWPSSEGLTWRTWLADLARYYRAAMQANPDLVEFAQTALDPDYERLEHATRLLVEFGFEPRTAGYAHAFLMNTVVGYVQQERHEAEAAARGQSALTRFVRALEADRTGEKLKTLRGFGIQPGDVEPDAAFEQFLGYALDGIAAQPGVPPTGQEKQ